MFVEIWKAMSAVNYSSAISYQPGVSYPKDFLPRVHLVLRLLVPEIVCGFSPFEFDISTTRWYPKGFQHKNRYNNIFVKNSHECNIFWNYFWLSVKSVLTQQYIEITFSKRLKRTILNLKPLLDIIVSSFQ